jgi:hypothetical protein
MLASSEWRALIAFVMSQVLCSGGLGEGGAQGVARLVDGLASHVDHCGHPEESAAHAGDVQQLSVDTGRAQRLDST